VLHGARRQRSGAGLRLLRGRAGAALDGEVADPRRSAADRGERGEAAPATTEMSDSVRDRMVLNHITRGPKMKLADVDVYELVHALGMERSAWIDAAKGENRRNTEAERITICVLAALERALKNAARASDPPHPR
jgi:hypothetical protein